MTRPPQKTTLKINSNTSYVTKFKIRPCLMFVEIQEDKKSTVLQHILPVQKINK